MVNTAKATLDGIVLTLDQDVNAKAISLADAEKYRTLLLAYRNNLKAAQLLVDQGDLSQAANQAKLLNDVLLQLQKELLARSQTNG